MAKTRKIARRTDELLKARLLRAIKSRSSRKPVVKNDQARLAEMCAA